MSCSKLSRTTHLFNPVYALKRHSSLVAPRGVSETLRLSSFLTGKAGGICGRNSVEGLWGMTFRSEYSTASSLGKWRQLSPLNRQGSYGGCLSLMSFRRHYASQAVIDRKSNKMLLYLTGLVFAMVGATYAAVPLYRTFCQATGYGGTVQRRESVEEKIARHAEDGTVTTRLLCTSIKYSVFVSRSNVFFLANK